MRRLAFRKRLYLTYGLCVLGMTTPAMAKTFIYVSAATDGIINIYSMDESSGQLRAAGTAAPGKSVMPMTASPDRKHLYAVVRSQPYRVVSYGIDADTGALQEQAVAALPDSMPYVSVEKQGRLLFFSSYGGNKIATLPVGPDGLVKDGVRQMIPTGQNAHSIVSDRSGRYVFATNLGSDVVLQFVLNEQTGMLEPNTPPAIATSPGQGPRHIAVSPDNGSVYVLTELSGEILHFSLDAATGTLKAVDKAAILPADSGLERGVAPPPPPPFNAPAAASPAPAAAPPRIWAADLAITPDGRFLYASERTTSTLALFRIIPETGSLERFGSISTEKQPRGIRVDPKGRFLVVSGEKSDMISVYPINSSDGKLGPAQRYPVGQGANWVEILDLP
ncbi:lactonase family protein [Allorhizobium undicola]|uniref:lactonase family protein n=1 Tax=Allorhizobium undicola TaxID=78527 RepID=UPI003D328F08